MKPSYLAIAIASMLSLSLVGCNKTPEGKTEAAAASQQRPPAKVSVVPVQFQTIPQYQTFAGRVTPYETATVVPEISGIVEEVLFREGTMVQKGQPLYRINPDNYVTGVASGESAIKQAQASLATAQAAKAQAQANYVSSVAALELANSDVARYQQLIGISAVSEQTYQKAITQQKTAQANVASAKAAVDQQDANIATAQANIDTAQATLASSQLSLGRTVVKAPISGVTNRSQVKAGTLVGAGQTAMVTISQLNPIYVDISQSSAEMLKLRKEVAEGKAQQGINSVELILEDGSVYPAKGSLQLREAQVDSNTGTMTMRAVFNNQTGVLLPGMYVATKVAQTVITNAMLLPQSAIMRSAKGETQVYVVGAENKIQVRPVTLSGTYEGYWIVTGGLQQGERVVVIGGATVKPEQQVMPEAYIDPRQQNNSADLPNGQSVNATQSNAQADSQPTEQASEQAQEKATPKVATVQAQPRPAPLRPQADNTETDNTADNPSASASVEQEIPPAQADNSQQPSSKASSANTANQANQEQEVSSQDAMTELEKMEAEAMASADNISGEDSIN